MQTTPRVLGWSRDQRTQRWMITCPGCQKEFEPITTRLAHQMVDCPKCGVEIGVDYNSEPPTAKFTITAPWENTDYLEREAIMNIATLTAALRGEATNAIIASTPGGIEQQEADGQRALVESAMVPKEVHGATREQLVALGFKFGDDIDELFVMCELPPGWTKRGTSHSMHSDLLDEHGRKRAGIFYKAAFYDRRSSMCMHCRFGVDCYLGGSDDSMFQVAVTDCGKVVKEFGEIKRDDYVGSSVLEKEAKEWLDAHRPEWKNPLACW